MLAKDISFDHSRLLGLCEIAYALGKDGIAVVCPAIFREKTNQTLMLCELFSYASIATVHRPVT